MTAQAMAGRPAPGRGRTRAEIGDGVWIDRGDARRPGAGGNGGIGVAVGAEAVVRVGEALASIAMLLATLGAPALAQHEHPSAPPPAQDTREAIAMQPADRSTVLAEMRVMLKSVHEIILAVATDDPAAVEHAARAAGMAAASEVEPHVKQQLPERFRQLGMATHKAFDALADQAKAGSPSKEVLRSLGGITANCVACHATYRLVEAPAAPPPH